MIRVLAASFLALVSCGGGQSAPGRPHPAPGPSSGSAATPAAPASTTPTPAECDQLLDHLIDLELAKASKGTPPDQMPTAEQKASIRSATAEKFRPECLKSPRVRVQCALAATTSDQLTACDDQASDSSSTSKSSVAPPGITPPAPRAP